MKAPKRNTYFKSLTRHYVKLIYHPSERIKNEILDIAEFLVNNQLMGQDHLEIIKSDIEYILQKGSAVITIDERYHGYYATLFLPKHTFYIGRTEFLELRK